MKSEAVWVPRERSFKVEDDYFLSALSNQVEHLKISFRQL